ncbi:MAG: UDP-N-acetylmuramate dehydrogenase [Chitinophagaceae bacterium]|nr:UDP-N-acetylmuramate dehydrogenase [Chitinophagaceae bacterium]
MQIQENISLKQLNTFGIEAKARRFAVFSDTDELEELLATEAGQPTLILGGGSNILLTKDVDGLVLKNEIKGIEELHEDADYVYVKAGAGENWHEFVQYCLKRNWAGLENLSLIPGLVGASPMQNIGAYGVEIAELFWGLEAFHLQEKKVLTFSLSDCEFGYRESVFKRKYKGQFVILNVTYRLRKKPVFHTGYGAIQQELEKMGVKDLSIQAISQAVINIRSSKLPDPKVTGNAGSFFKNPEIQPLQYDLLKEKFPEAIAYSLVNGNYKLAAGWLIEQCGWKGFREGDAGVHPKQALVLVNYGHASGRDIYDLSEKILLSVKEKFDVELEREVNIL